MNQPDSKSSQSKWIFLAVALIVTAGLYFQVLRWMVNAWTGNPDYSHGFLVPFFAAYILWSNRKQLEESQDDEKSNSGVLWGSALIAAGLVMRGVGFYTMRPTVEAISLLLVVFGIILLFLGARAWRWAWAPVLFLVFMIPLPGFLSTQLAGALQKIATILSTVTLQLLGFTAFAEGNVIALSNGQIGVAEACSGLRMLYSFFALTAGACLLIDRTWVEKVIIALSAIPIAIIANCIRIVATGIAYEYFDGETAEHFFHDVAGWLMMPLGFLLLLIVLAILDRSLVVEQEEPDFA